MSEEVLTFIRIFGLFDLPPGSYRVCDIETRQEREMFSLIKGLKDITVEPDVDLGSLPVEPFIDPDTGEKVTPTRVKVSLGRLVTIANIGEALQGLVFENGSMMIVGREFADSDAQALAENAKGEVIQSLKRIVRNRKAAKLPRKEVSREEIESFRDNFIQQYHQSRGWKKAACTSLKIDMKTLNKRLKE